MNASVNLKNSKPWTVEENRFIQERRTWLCQEMNGTHRKPSENPTVNQATWYYRWRQILLLTPK